MRSATEPAVTAIEAANRFYAAMEQRLESEWLAGKLFVRGHRFLHGRVVWRAAGRAIDREHAAPACLARAHGATCAGENRRQRDGDVVEECRGDPFRHSCLPSRRRNSGNIIRASRIALSSRGKKPRPEVIRTPTDRSRKLGVACNCNQLPTSQETNEQPERVLRNLLVGTAIALSSLAAGAADDPGLISQGKEIFRFDTFGDEQLWTDKLGLHKVVETKVDPTTALKVGLKVDSECCRRASSRRSDLKSPATTVALLKLNAVVGLKAEVDANNHITRLGVTCALCHSTVDDSVQPGIGKRLDGWPNRDLDVGKIISLSPALTAEQKKVYTSWGPGKYDPRYNQDGKNIRWCIPPAYGLANVKNETYTAEGPISYWNAYVAVTQMGGQGNFKDERLSIDVKHSPDLVTSKLPALRAYQHSLPAPRAAGVELRRHGGATRQGRCSTAPARPATWVATARTTTPASCISRPRPDRTPPTPCAPRTRRTARRRCAACSSTRRTSTTAARRRSATWSSTTTRSVRSNLTKDQQARSRGVPEDAVTVADGAGWRTPGADLSGKSLVSAARSTGLTR